MNAPPPIHITGNPALDWIILAGGFLVALYWLRALRLAREGVRRLLVRLAKTVVVYFGASIAFGLSGRFDTAQARNLSCLAAFFTFVFCYTRTRSRYIPAGTKRSVIARDLPDGGYDPKFHHIDHVWPHSRGGSNTADNLRVIEKKRNLRKGAKRPRMREMF